METTTEEQPGPTTEQTPQPPPEEQPRKNQPPRGRPRKKRKSHGRSERVASEETVRQNESEDKYAWRVRKPNRKLETAKAPRVRSDIKHGDEGEWRGRHVGELDD